VRSITFTFSFLEWIHRFYISLVRSQPKYASVVWNSITLTYANKVERIQQRFAALCFNCFLHKVYYRYSLAPEEVKLNTLHMSRHLLDALFLIQIFIKSVLLFWNLLSSSSYSVHQRLWFVQCLLLI
jgi:hypothetical protein